MAPESASFVEVLPTSSSREVTPSAHFVGVDSPVDSDIHSSIESIEKGLSHYADTCSATKDTPSSGGSSSPLKQIVLLRYQVNDVK